MENSVLRAHRDTHRLCPRSGSMETGRRAGEHDSTGATTERIVGQTADSAVPQITEEIEEVTLPRNASRVEESRVQLVTRERVQDQLVEDIIHALVPLCRAKKKRRDVSVHSAHSVLRASLLARFSTSVVSSPVMGARAGGGRSRCVL